MSAEQIPPSVPDILAHGGWLATAILAAWGWVTRMALGRHFKALDKMSERVEDMTETMGGIDKRLARIEGRFEQQDHEK